MFADVIVFAVGSCNEDISSGPEIDIIIDESLDVLVLPDEVLSSDDVELSHKGVDRSVPVHPGLPKSFPIFGVVAAMELVLSAVVHNGDTVGEESVDESVLELVVGGVVIVEEAGLVVVVVEHTEDAHVRVLVLGQPCDVADGMHGVLALVGLSGGKVDGVVQH